MTFAIEFAPNGALPSGTSENALNAYILRKMYQHKIRKIVRAKTDNDDTTYKEDDDDEEADASQENNNADENDNQGLYYSQCCAQL